MKPVQTGIAQISKMMHLFLDKGTGGINVDLKALRKSGVFEIQFDGPEIVAPYSGEKCVWHHCVRKLNKGFGEISYLGRSKIKELIIIAPECTMEFKENRIEPYLKPSYVSEELSENRTFMVSEYILKPEQTYYAEIGCIEWYRSQSNIPLYKKKQKHFILKIYDQFPQNGKIFSAKIPPFGDLSFN